MLVICKAIPEDLAKTGDFVKGGIYRHMPDGKFHFVNGYGIPEITFSRCFKPLAPIFKALIEKTGFAKRELLTKDAFESIKPVSKTEFINNIADVHTYGRGSRKRFIVCIGHPKENMFLIYSNTSTKKEATNFAYETMTELLKGNIARVDIGYVHWTNRGVPIAYNYNGSIVGKAYDNIITSALLGE